MDAPPDTRETPLRRKAPARALATALTVALAGALGLATPGCGSTRPQTRFEDPATLLAERDEWAGPREGTVVLRYHVEAIVDARPDPSRATSRLVVHLVLARFSGPLAPLDLPLPAGATRIRTELRLPERDPAAFLDEKAPDSLTKSTIDPTMSTTSIRLPEPPEGSIVEAILEYEIPGTLASDARWLGFASAPIGELLFRYSLPSHGVGRLTTTLEGARPLTIEKDGRTLVALMARALPARAPSSAPLARFVLASASPLGFTQDFASTWDSVAQPYLRALPDLSPSLTDGFAVPHRAQGAEDALHWVQARPLGGAAMDAPWNAPQKLPQAVATNTLSAVDKVHLLAWLLREARIPHLFAMGRPAELPRLSADLPVPGAFSAPLLYLPGAGEDGKVLDPACATCQVGEVRPELRGGQALLLLTPAALPEGALAPPSPLLSLD